MFPKKVKESLMINDLCIIGDDNNMKSLLRYNAHINIEICLGMSQRI